jgi:hypothetical protein
VVENGTGRRASGAFTGPDGAPLVAGGKTGTGDHRYERFGRGGEVIESQVVNRTATFVFFLGDRFYGVISAHVAGPDAAGYGFTSALPTQLLRSLAPELQPLLERVPHAPPAGPPPIAEGVDGTVLGQVELPCRASDQHRWRCSLAGVVQSAAREETADVVQ